MSRGALDWSRVADGNATHYDPVYGNFLQQGIGHSLVWHNGRGWARQGGQYPDDLSQLSNLVKREAKPAAWTGEGLPPVGTVCETWHVCQPADVKVRTILFVGRSLVVMSDELRGEVTGRLEKIQFRPVRTPEQIAAEQIADVVRTLDLRHMTDSHAKAIGQALADAGLRFPEGGAQ